jgi:hypothetical protein
MPWRSPWPDSLWSNFNRATTPCAVRCPTGSAADAECFDPPPARKCPVTCRRGVSIAAASKPVDLCCAASPPRPECGSTTSRWTASTS